MRILYHILCKKTIFVTKNMLALLLLREFCAAYEVSLGETRRNVAHSACRLLPSEEMISNNSTTTAQAQIIPRAAIPLALRATGFEPQGVAIQKDTRGVSFCIGAPAGTRIPDPLIKSQMLYQLSYRGLQTVLQYNNTTRKVCQYFFKKYSKISV